MKKYALLRLIRFHKPIGTLLLWFPTAWALWLANKGTPPLLDMFYFFMGTFLMRSAGCIQNDIADRQIDQHVKRTEDRPLTSHEISLPTAIFWLILFLLGAFIILIQLPKTCFYYALSALAITLIYPFCKRFFEAPQLILSVAFSMGIPMAYAASHHAPDKVMWCLMLLNACWIIAYDTLYAMADRQDDQRIGVKSTALLFGEHCEKIIFMFQLIAHGLWLWISWHEHLHLAFYVLWGAGLVIVIYQQQAIHRATEESTYLRIFSSHMLYGLTMWLALIFGL